jgi:integrase
MPLQKDKYKPLSLSTFQRTYRVAFKKLGIQGYDNHDWRATYGTQLKEAGMTSAQVADMLGHADTRMVETVYARCRREGVLKHKDALEKLNQQYIRGTCMVQKDAV